MTTIAYRDGIMAADTRAYSGSHSSLGFKRKIHRLGDGSLIGVSSSKVGEPERFRRMVEELGVEGNFENDRPVQALIVKLDGSVFYFNDNKAFSGPVDAEFFAIGSGEDFAAAAMMMGASAEKAVKIAIAGDVWTGGEVETLSLGGE